MLIRGLMCRFWVLKGKQYLVKAFVFNPSYKHTQNNDTFQGMNWYLLQNFVMGSGDSICGQLLTRLVVKNSSEIQRHHEHFLSQFFYLASKRSPLTLYHECGNQSMKHFGKFTSLPFLVDTYLRALLYHSRSTCLKAVWKILIKKYFCQCVHRISLCDDVCRLLVKAIPLCDSPSKSHQFQLRKSHTVPSNLLRRKPHEKVLQLQNKLKINL